MSETVTIIRGAPGVVDEYGDPIAGQPPQRFDIEGCEVEPRITKPPRTLAEPTLRGREPIIDGIIVYAPAGSPEVLYTDQCLVRGVLHEVLGVPGVWAGMGVEIALLRAQG